jgi:uncharacterized membrane protein YeaQ/YmgE (transglycosylase-associated protein family)
MSILIGITGANIAGYLYRKFSLGITGNTIAGVFGSIFLVKSLGRLGFDPKSIMQSGNVNFSLLALNVFFSFLGGAIAVILIYKLKIMMNG